MKISYPPKILKNINELRLLMNSLPLHYQETLMVPVSPSDLFNYIDDHKNLSSHMNKPSIMMGGGMMKTILDDGQGKKVGSHIKLEGSAFGIQIKLDEAVTKHLPPYTKTWETVEYPQLIIIGNYRMGFEIEPDGNNSKFTVFIDYELPKGNTKWLGILFSKFYAKWCVRQMTDAARQITR